MNRLDKTIFLLALLFVSCGICGVVSSWVGGRPEWMRWVYVGLTMLVVFLLALVRIIVTAPVEPLVDEE
ncbi:MAG: hypothetical protein H6661_04110 [Ardenticatenaceae bacterium]|nr:hypothetical protein [Ardenticatenaceae bacterium]